MRETIEKIAAACVVGAAAPVAVVSGVTSLGFGSGGVVAGSTAAGWMAAGGGVTPFLVSVGQAIGATGSLVVGAGGLATAGIVAAAAGVTYAVVPASAVQAVERGVVAAAKGSVSVGGYLFTRLLGQK